MQKWHIWEKKKNYKTVTKETEDDKNRWKDTPHSWIGRINIVKMTTLGIPW